MKKRLKALLAFFADFKTIKCDCGRTHSSVDQCVCEYEELI